jgi:hypothetical protein
MFNDLPEIVQKQILHYLTTDNFKAAKNLHDNWLKHQTEKNQGIQKSLEKNAKKARELRKETKFLSEKLINRLLTLDS